MVVIVVVVEGLSQEIEAVEMVQTFDVCGETTAIFRGDLHLIGPETCGFGFRRGNGECADWERIRTWDMVEERETYGSHQEIPMQRQLQGQHLGGRH